MQNQVFSFNNLTPQIPLRNWALEMINSVHFNHQGPDIKSFSTNICVTIKIDSLGSEREIPADGGQVSVNCNNDLPL